MNRWTIQQLESIDDVDFAIQILYERKMALNPYSPLAKKLDEAAHTLQEIRNERQSKPQAKAEKVGG